VLVQSYEDAHFPLESLTTPQDVVAFMLEQKGFSQDDLAQWLGGKDHRPLGLPLGEAAH
jgi:antitoxin component HigA of HigAB toxin-antitoxin module